VRSARRAAVDAGRDDGLERGAHRTGVRGREGFCRPYSDRGGPASGSGRTVGP
jgi:hypothetical protein